MPPDNLLERHLAAVVRGLLDRIDQAMQFNRGLEGRLVGFAVADRRANSVYI